MNYYLFLSIISITYFFIVLIAVEKKTMKREFAGGFVFVLMVFFAALDPNQKNMLMFLIFVLTVYNVYLIFKKYK